MLDKIKRFFSEHLDVDAQQTPQQAMEMAAAALLIELSRADFEHSPEEYTAIKKALRERFQLSGEQLESLIALAEEQNREATSLFEFTRLVNEHYSTEQKFALLQALWEVAAADSDISKYEDHLIRKIADLIYLPHSEFIRAKLSVLSKGSS